MISFQQQRPSFYLWSTWIGIVFALLMTGCASAEPSHVHQTTPSESPIAIYRASDHDLVACSVRDQHQIWRYQTEAGSLHSQLIVNGQRIYFTTDRLSALDATTGKLLWDRAFPASPERLVIQDKTLYVLAGMVLAAINTQDGALLWQQSYPDMQAPFSQLYLDGDRLYLTSRWTLLCLAKLTGKLLWSRETIDGESIQQLVTSDPVLMIQTPLQLQAYEEDTGALLWSRQTQTQALTISGQTVTIAFIDAIAAQPVITGLRSLNLFDGSVRWQVQTPLTFQGHGWSTPGNHHCLCPGPWATLMADQRSLAHSSTGDGLTYCIPSNIFIQANRK